MHEPESKSRRDAPHGDGRPKDVPSGEKDVRAIDARAPAVADAAEIADQVGANA